MSKIMLSAAMTAEKSPDGTLDMNKVQYIFEFEKQLQQYGHQVWHSLQDDIKPEIDRAFEKSFAAGKGYDLGMKRIYELIEDFRENEEIRVIGIGKGGPQGLIKSTGMNLECEYFSKASFAKLLAIVPKGRSNEMKNWTDASKIVLPYDGEISNTNTIENLARTIEIII